MFIIYYLSHLATNSVSLHAKKKFLNNIFTKWSYMAINRGKYVFIQKINNNLRLLKCADSIEKYLRLIG